jgi:hypothetical protein
MGNTVPGVETLSGGVESLSSGVAGGVGSLSSGVVGGVESLSSGVGSLSSGVAGGVESLSSGVGTLSSGVAGGVESFAGGVGSLSSGVAGSVESLAGSVSLLPSLDVMSVLGKGTTVTKENKHKPILIAPRDLLRQIGRHNFSFDDGRLTFHCYEPHRTHKDWHFVVHRAITADLLLDSESTLGCSVLLSHEWSSNSRYQSQPQIRASLVAVPFHGVPDNVALTLQYQLAYPDQKEQAEPGNRIAHIGLVLMSHKVGNESVERLAFSEAVPLGDCVSENQTIELSCKRDAWFDLDGKPFGAEDVDGYSPFCVGFYIKLNDFAVSRFNFQISGSDVHVTFPRETSSIPDASLAPWRFIPGVTEFRLNAYLTSQYGLPDAYWQRVRLIGITIDGKMVLDPIDPTEPSNKLPTIVIPYSPMLLSLIKEASPVSSRLLDNLELVASKNTDFRVFCLRPALASRFNKIVKDSSHQYSSVLDVCKGIHSFENVSATVAITGEAVRDILLGGNHVKHFDVVVASTLQRTEQALSGVLSSGNQSVTVRVFKGEKKMVTLHDKCSWGNDKEVVDHEYMYGWSYADDAATRDYTVNCLYVELYSPVPIVVDPTGNGIDDLFRRHWRRVSPGKYAQDIGAHIRLFKTLMHLSTDDAIWSFEHVSSEEDPDYYGPLSVYVSKKLMARLDRIFNYEDMDDNTVSEYFAFGTVAGEASAELVGRFQARVQDIQDLFGLFCVELFSNPATANEDVTKFHVFMHDIVKTGLPDGQNWWTALVDGITRKPIVGEVAKIGKEFKVATMIAALRSLQPAV